MEMCKQLHTSDEIVFWTVQFFVGLLGIFNTNCRLFWTKFSHGKPKQLLTKELELSWKIVSQRDCRVVTRF